MSKDKGSRETKKLPNPVGKKGPSDYQSGKTSSSSLDSPLSTKKKK
jgi:hypothetical protein